MATFTRLTGNAVIFGTTDADLITTGAGDDLILAGAGANTIIAGDGANLIIAAAGDDVITTGLGNDTILAGAGNNRIRAGAGANTIVTGSGNDNIASGNGNDFIDAGAGNNLIDAGDGVNNITTGLGNDTITSGSGNDTINAGAGNNTVDAGGGVNNITTGLGNDSITSGSGNDTINAGAGTNVINAGDGANNITTGAGNDTITSGSGNDAINAGAGNNIVNAGDGTNTVTTGAGNDTLSTGAGNDNINAGDGVNSVSSGAGSDVVTTGAGADTVDAGRGSDVVRSGAGNDVIVHRIAENLGFVDQYDGGAGQDSLRLDLSSAEWARADVQADVAAFLARANPAASFRFNSSKVTVVNVERLEVFVEGVRLANPANEAVRAVADSLSITDGSSVSSINLLLNDGVPDRATSVTLLDISPLEVSPLGASTLGTATLVTSLDGAVQTASLNFVPDASLQSLAQGQSLSETLQYRVQDVNGDFSIGNVTITVTGTNDAPVALDDAAITREGTSVSIAVLANDSDPERDPLTITQVADRPIAVGSPVTLSDPSTSATLGQVALTPTGELVFTPAPGFSGPVEFTYTVSDGSATDQGLVKISVDAVNDPPDARDDLITGNEDTTLNFRPEANDSKVDGQPPRITAINGIPIELRDPPIQLTNGIVYKAPAVPQGSTELQFRPNANFNGEQTFEYTISDGRGGTDTATVTIQVAPVNDAPAGGDAAATVTEGDAYTLTARDFGFSDPDVGDSLKAVRIDSLPTNGTLQLNGSPVTALALVTAEQIAAGALKFVPDAGENGSPYGSFRFSVQDQSNAFDPVPNTFTLNVIGGLTVNSVPVNEGDIATFTVGIPGSAETTLIKLAVSTADPRFTAEDADLAPPGALVVSFVGPVGDVITLMPAADGTYTVPAGVTRLQVGVPTVQDQVNEGPETFGLTVTSTSPTVSNGTVGVTAEGRINDQEGPGSDLPVIGISVSSAPVGEEGPAVLLYTVAITNGKTSEFPMVVNYTVGGSALEGVDYLAPSRSVSIPAGETFTSFRVAAFDDSVFEGRETVVVTLQSASSNGLSLPLANTVATGSIDDSSGPGSDKPIVGINVAPALVQEDGPANLVYTVAITNGKTSNASTEVSFTLTGTATAGADYGPVTRTVTIPPGENSATFVVDPFGDLAFEGNETVVATLVSASTAGVPLGLDPARTAAVGTIVDNDLLSQGTVPTAQEAALSTGTSPTLNTELVTGRMAGSDAANPNFSWRLGAPPAGIIKSGGANVLWATSADGKSVTGTVSEIVNGTVTVKPIATLTINDAGDYSFSLQGPVDHPAGGAPNQALAINFSATASPGGAGGVTATVPLTINVQDDQPQQPVAPTGLSATIANTNLMFVLDLSGSMNEPSGIPGLSRLQAAVDSITRLIDKYDALGETTVRLVTFNNEAAVRNAFVDSDVFVNLSNPSQKQGWNDLLQVIRNSPPSNFGNANHDAALATAISAWDAGGKIAGAQNVAYFLASSLPTAAKGSAASLVGAFNQDASDLGIQPSEEAAWTTFLAARNLQSHAIGIGPGIATGAAALAPVAYDGQAEENRNGQIVTDLTQLDTVLNDTLPKSIQGKLVGSLTTGGAGADGGLYLKSVVIGGETYSFTPDASGVGGGLSGPLPRGSSFDPATASLTVASTASVGAKLVIDFDGGSYSFDSPAVTGTESIVYTVADRDGDVSSPASLQIQVDAATASVIGDDFGNQLSGDARVNTVFGKGGDDVLLGVGGNDRLFGNAGNDNLDGGDGNDDLSGGAGTDQLLGGPGNDKLSGGIGSDVFAWRFADQGAPGAGRALDTIDDFNVAPVAQGGDVLDLRDLLIGEAQGVNGSAGNLQGFLDILVVGGSTEIRVSTAGGFTGGNYGTGTAEDQHITLTGVNLSTGLVPGQTLSEAQIIENLLRNGKLITD